ncbi:putative Rac prophage; prophage lambda endopeptidase [Xenorhabdus bovienii str. Jollieti]|uniref:Putative Rac prophage prophage lambda endopeptidase n=1 Tax=Xenorhabdus bovienii (strain SS-2004) TaxID=406818 RepID=D3UWJ5_XENBS|nr:lysis protein [Xenorhabdus bovienii]CBJ79830.1 putative Rac prophage; prophage lambda endopeptidase [Xenorhabdus bovienii SS-2004]CDH29559.1 putative Rac prophage; prophage lambda endopeptidase [Xenorhabdus bovienii str. Jollieti]
MKFNSQYFTVGALVVVSGLLWFFYSEYQQKAQDYSELDTKHQTQLIAINEQQKRIQRLAELDSKHRQELDNAKSEIDTLRADVAAGRRKLRIKAICPVSETVASGSVGDATTVELSGETGSTVLDIRESIISDRAKLRYLQEYVNTECRGNDGNIQTSH